jgi:hypothetical protein
MKTFECCHADTCLPDYWPGHHLPHICIPVYPMTLDEVKAALHDELSSGAVCGSVDFHSMQDDYYIALHDAIDSLSERDGFTGLHFADVDESADIADHVYAYFVFVERE